MRHCLALTTLVIGLSAASAGSVAGTGSLGRFSGSFDYNEMTRQLTIALLNESLPAGGGYLVAFAFNLPNGVVVESYDPSPSGGAFQLLGGAGVQNAVNVAPYGNADTGAALGGSWVGGGSPRDGLAVGDSATWSFRLAGEVTGLTAKGIFSEQTSKGGPGFVVRFRGFEDGGSDKVVGEWDDEPTGGVVDTPEPGTLTVCAVIGGVGLVGGFQQWRRNRSARAITTV